MINDYFSVFVPDTQYHNIITTHKNIKFLVIAYI